MAFSKGVENLEKINIINEVSEFEIARRYFNIDKIPSLICNPLRLDNHPSLGLYSSDGVSIKYIDFATKDNGDIFTLLCKYWNLSYNEVLARIKEELGNNTFSNSSLAEHKSKIKNITKYNDSVELLCKVREWRTHDINFWKSFGISLKWLKYAEVYPVSHKIIIKDNKKYVFPADKYAYVYVEHKEGKTTLKLYQPFNTQGYKWLNKHDASVISLWTKVPENGDKICICSSLKDALCLWANTGIPSIAVQGEGYIMSTTAINELKRRYNKVFILFDNDEAGLIDGKKLSELTGFINVVLPYFEGGKDVSDLMQIKGKEEFLEIVLPLFQ